MNEDKNLSLSDLFRIVIINKSTFLFLSILTLLFSTLFYQFNDKGYKSYIILNIIDNFTNPEMEILTLTDDNYINNFIRKENLFRQFLKNINKDKLSEIIAEDKRLWLNDEYTIFNNDEYNENELIKKYADQYSLNKIEENSYKLSHISKSPQESINNLYILSDNLNAYVFQNLNKILELREDFLINENKYKILFTKSSINQVENEYKELKKNYLNQLKSHYEIAERLKINENSLAIGNSAMLTQSLSNSESLQISNFFDANNVLEEKTLFGSLLDKYKRGTVSIHEEIKLLEKSNDNIINYKNYSIKKSELTALELRLGLSKYISIKEDFLERQTNLTAAKISMPNVEDLSFNAVLIFVPPIISLWFLLLSFYSIKLILSRNIT